MPVLKGSTGWHSGERHRSITIQIWLLHLEVSISDTNNLELYEPGIVLVTPRVKEMFYHHCQKNINVECHGIQWVSHNQLNGCVCTSWKWTFFNDQQEKNRRHEWSISNRQIENNNESKNFTRFNVKPHILGNWSSIGAKDVWCLRISGNEKLQIRFKGLNVSYRKIWVWNLLSPKSD